MHIRRDRCNDPNCKTLCGLAVFADTVDRTTKRFKYREWPAEGKPYVLHSIPMGAADTLDTGYWGSLHISAEPDLPPLRAWDFCLACWDSPYRILRTLNETSI